MQLTAYYFAYYSQPTISYFQNFVYLQGTLIQMSRIPHH